MQSQKKMYKPVILFIILMTITFAVVFNNYDIKKTVDIILKANLLYIVLAILSMFLSITFESINIKNIVSNLGNKISIIKSLKYTLIGFLFSGITPGGSGGQPIEIYYMKKEQIPITSSTLALLVQICCFHIITIILGVIGLFYNIELLHSNFIWIFILGITFKIIILIIMLIGLFSKKISKFLINIVLKILKKIKYRNIDELTKQINIALEQYQKSAKYIKQNKTVFIKSLIIVLMQIITNYTVTYFIYRALGLSQHNIIYIVLIQSLMILSTSSLPLPGSVGIGESTFLTIYITVFGKKLIASAMLLSRGITFYLFMLISLIVFSVNLFKIKKINHLD